MPKNIKTIRFVIGDISLQDTQAIVNAANKTLLGGGGVDGAIHKAAGPELLEECKTLEGCKTGEAKLTKAYKLKSDYVIHTVGPVYKNGSDEEKKLLALAYRNSLKLAIAHGIKSISFPSISTGAYRYPVKEASYVAIKEVLLFVSADPNAFSEIRFVLFTKSLYDVFISSYNELIQDFDWR